MIFTIIFCVIELFIIAFLVKKLAEVLYEKNIAVLDARKYKNKLDTFKVDYPTLLNLINQAKALNWDIGIQQTILFDDKTKKLLALANKSSNENEAKNAAIQACKRISKVIK